ncbi:HpcH/HpaI aldolase/citrate lyase family protein [Halobaculum sp. MBLA0147]|uniref:HpcH/HpaI aldolase family protein n=1 Tax=Halobaculum sp. MBLA0147 TaxID=3079934 RepID=UPI0035242467
MQDAGIRERLREGAATGVWLSIPSPTVAEVVAGTDADFVVADTEHTSSSVETVEAIVRAVEAASGETAPLVRAAWNDHVRIKRLLDTGAAGVIAPQVESAAEARSFVDATRYPPEGDRGLAAGRASAYGTELDDYYETAGDRLARIVQIESPTAVDAVGEIAAVDGVDSVFVGPADLSASLGMFGEYDVPAFREAVERVLADSEVPVGTLAVTPDQVDHWREVGFDYQVVATDVDALQRGVAASLDRVDEA